MGVDKEGRLSATLRDLIDELQEKFYNYEIGRRPTICSEDALKLLKKYRPRTMEELKNIRGIGETFIEKYGSYFLDAINKCIDEDAIILGDKEKTLLSKLENRLININRRNRLLYSSKINKDFGIDIFKFVEKPEQLEKFVIERKTTTFKILNIEDFEDDKLKRILKLIRQSNKIDVETGNNELYIAYPFVQGKMENEDFIVKAPLILFPVEIIRDRISISIKNDFSRDVIYNTHLILANNKFNGKNEVLPNNEIEEYSSDFVKSMLKFYESNGFYIPSSKFGLEKFLENKLAEFPKYKNGEFEIKGYMVLGIYSMYVTAMYSDFHRMIESSETTELIEELLIGRGEYTTDGIDNFDNISREETYKIEDKIEYINELDFSQEKVLEKSKNTNAMVVQGPPGTGKSQTITSLIIQNILQGNKVLMVSEKKTALDVIYSRLGVLSNYAMIIDDVENKDEFYSQLNKFLDYEENHFNCEFMGIENLWQEKYAQAEKIKMYIEQINDAENKLTAIAELVYGINDFGIPYYNLYNKVKKINFLDEKERELYKIANDLIPVELRNLKYNELEHLWTRFNEEGWVERLIDFMHKSENNKFYLKILSNLSEREKVDFVSELRSFKERRDAYEEYNFIKKLFAKSRLEEEAKTIVNKYFKPEDILWLTSVVFDSSERIIKFVATDYDNFFENKNIYDKLNKIENIYLKIIYRLREYLSDKTIIEINEYLYNLILCDKIEVFEKSHPEVLIYINDFDEIIKKIKENVSNKKEATRILAFITLLTSRYKICENGNEYKIQELAGRKRKMTINKFMNKFRFEMMDSIKIWLMTPEVVSDIFPFEKELFDLVIFDEASQLYVEKAIPAIYRAKKVVVAGDSKQLKPSSLGKGRILDDVDEDEIDDGLLEYESLLDAAEYKYSKTMLNYHYRSRYSELISFSNYAFYNGKLLVSAAPNKSSNPPIERIKVEDGRWIDKKNIAEGEEVVRLVKQILKERKNNETIGVITFNVSQMQLIDELIEKEKMEDAEFAIKMNAEEKRLDNGENIGFFVKNIESVQGDERDIIIFCIGYAKNEAGRVAINFGWLNQDGGENRLNVAISRAKHKIYVVTSIEPEELVVDNTRNDGPKLFKEYLRYTKAISENDSKLAQSILLSLLDSKDTTGSQLTYDSVFEEEVANKLQDMGYNISTQYGVGGYRIDIVVKSKTGQDVLLGIECDGRLYHSSKYARERDYHRQKYLESRGWKIYRIWSTNWWKNPEFEINKLKKYIESLEKRETAEIKLLAGAKN